MFHPNCGCERCVRELQWRVTNWTTREYDQHIGDFAYHHLESPLVKPVTLSIVDPEGEDDLPF